MSIISPRSSEFATGSSMAFVKPLPQRGGDTPGVGMGDSAEFDVGAVPLAQASTLELWRKLLPDTDQPMGAASSCMGVKLGHFRLEEQIGRGGMGAVFRAIDTRLDREVALKVLAGPQSGDQAAVDRFLNEARAAARLDHDNVARVYYVGEDQGLHFIAFEFIHGANVRQVIDARGVLSSTEAVNYGLQIAHALRHVADAGVVHRDVKPSNIIITPTGRAKLVDLGLARKHDPEASKDLTVDGTTLGTFDYISPEQAKDPRKVDIRSDIYSLGCTLYHMLTGEPPYPQGTMLQKLLDHQGKDVPSVADRNGNVPPELSAVVKKMMASDPTDRYASADELISDLSILAHAYGLQPTTPGSLVWSSAERTSGWTLLRRYRSWLVTAALLVFAVLALDVIQSETRSGSSEQTAQIKVTSGETPRDGGSSITESLESASGFHEIGPALPDSFVPPSSIAKTPPESIDTAETGERIFDALSLPLQTEHPSDWVFGQDTPPLLHGSDTGPGVPFNLAESATATGNMGERSLVPDSPVFIPGETPAPDTVVVEERLLQEPFVVRVDDEAPKGYVSLEAACRDAPDGSTIDLNFDGDSGELQRPVRWVGKRLVIRASAGRRPVIRFAAPEGLTSAQIIRMIEVREGAIEVYNVDFIVKIDPNFSTDQWVLLSLSQADAVTLRGVSVTIDKPQSVAVSTAIVELAESLPEFGDRMPETLERPPLRFEAEDCFFRGQADLFRNENVDRTRILLRNVAVALGGSLVRILGESVDVSTDMSGEHVVELELRHVTASLASEMVLFEVDPGKSVPSLTVSAGNSVLVLNEKRSLVKMTGDIDPFDAQELLDWSGGDCFVETEDPIWSINGLYDRRDVGLSEWNDLWKEGRLERPGEVPLLRRDPATLDSAVTADDLTLTPANPGENPARGGASDGTDAGVLWESPRLPQMPLSSDDIRPFSSFE